MSNSSQPSQLSPAAQASPTLRIESRNFADTFERLPTNSIIHSPSFTFLVGPKHTKLTIQSGLAQHVSKPLHNLMNNGHTRESKHRIAVLEDEDVETFVAFCEYAYTGDYKVPQLPVPVPAPMPAPSPREDTRPAVVESVTSTAPSWRGTYRSDSVSSAVPPPAPSPPPGSETDCQTVRAEGEVPPAVEEDVSAEVAAEETAEAEAGPEMEAEAEAVEAKVHEPATTEEAQESPGTEEPVEHAEPIDQPKETGWAQYQVPEYTTAEAIGQIAPEAGEPAGEEPWEAEPAYQANTKKSKKAKSKKGKKKSQQQPLEDEPPASLTPPSTPPPQEPEVVEIQPEPEPELEPTELALLPVEDEAVDAEEDVRGEDAPPEVIEEEAPAEEPPSSTLPSPMPSPSAAPTEWPQPTDYPPQEDENAPEPMCSMSFRTTSRTNSPTINAPHSPKPIIDMSFAKQSDSSPHTPGLSLWDEFAALQYNDETAVPSTPKPSTSTTTTTTDLPYLTFHAKVYVFATRYLIPALAQLCLRKLHTDLVHLPLGDDNEEYPDTDADTNTLTRSGAPAAPAIVLDVLRYAYTKTTRLEPINPTSATQLRENELRRLVVHYAACRVKELARWHGGSGSGSATPAVRGVGVDGTRPDSLRALLDGTPELASDLVYRMM